MATKYTYHGKYKDMEITRKIHGKLQGNFTEMNNVPMEITYVYFKARNRHLGVNND